MGAKAYRGNTPQALAILHHALLNVLRGRGWKRIADALRQYGAAVERALWLIDALPPGFDFTLQHWNGKSPGIHSCGVE